MTKKITKPLDLVDKPVLLEDQSQKIVYTNKKALHIFNRIENGWNVFLFQDYFDLYDRTGTVCTYRPTGDLYSFQEELTSQNDQIYKKITLTPLCETVTPLMIQSYQVMAEKLVHQFRSPLTSVNGFVEMLAAGRKDGKKETRDGDYIEKIGKGLDQTFSLLDQIEDFASPVSVEYSVFTLDSLLLSLAEDFDPPEMARMSIQKSSKTIKINSDYYLLRKILVELLKNALEATRKNRGEEICLNAGPDGFLEVKNRMPVLSAEEFQSIFLPFYSTKALQVGLGLPKCLLYSHKLGLDLHMKLDHQSGDVMFQISGFPYSLV